MEKIDFSADDFIGFSDNEDILVDTGVLLAYLNRYDSWSEVVTKLFNEHILAEDNRLSERDGTFVGDNNSKIIVINNNLAIAFAGNAGIQVLFEEFLKWVRDKDNFRIEDVLFPRSNEPSGHACMYI